MDTSVIFGEEKAYRSIITQDNLPLDKKLEILSDAAKYDVACTSSGVERGGKEGTIGNTAKAGICHTFTPDGRCISLLKILYTNHCIFDCKYCINRTSNDILRTSFTPEEVCTLTIEFYRRNYIEGLFLSSGIKQTPNQTMEEICETLMLLRTKYHFNGYIHCKAIPGADSALIELAGWYADRMSINLELPTAEGLRTLAPHKSRKNILTPMRLIQGGIEENMQQLRVNDSRGAYWYTARANGRTTGIPEAFQPKSLYKKNFTSTELHTGDVTRDTPEDMEEDDLETPNIWNKDMSGKYGANPLIDFSDGRATGQHSLSKAASVENHYLQWKERFGGTQRFVPAGQSTQMIIGATAESDYQIISVAESLYRNFDLKRVFYSAFIRVNDDSQLPVLPGGTPLLREHRLYQADWLLRYYGFEASELLNEQTPNFNVVVDPKCDWAIRHLERFPVEVNRADYFTLLRVPGIGVKSAKRIVAARKQAKLTFHDLKKIGVVLKRAVYFITCCGKMMYHIPMEENFIFRNLASGEEQLPLTLRDDLREEAITFRQLSLFDDIKYGAGIGQ